MIRATFLRIGFAALAAGWLEIRMPTMTGASPLPGEYEYVTRSGWWPGETRERRPMPAIVDYDGVQWVMLAEDPKHLPDAGSLFLGSLVGATDEWLVVEAVDFRALTFTIGPVTYA